MKEWKKWLIDFNFKTVKLDVLESIFIYNQLTKKSSQLQEEFNCK